MHRARARVGVQRCLRSAWMSVGYRLLLLVLLAVAIPAAWNLAFGRTSHLRALR